MSGILVLILRIIFTLLLYAFLYWALSVIWRDLRGKTQELTHDVIPALLITPLDSTPEEIMRFQTSEVILGRDTLCNLCVPHETVSARHARFTFQQNQWWVEDLNSTNGTVDHPCGHRKRGRASLRSVHLPSRDRIQKNLIAIGRIA